MRRGGNKHVNASTGVDIRKHLESCSRLTRPRGGDRFSGEWRSTDRMNTWFRDAVAKRLIKTNTSVADDLGCRNQWQTNIARHCVARSGKKDWLQGNSPTWEKRWEYPQVGERYMVYRYIGN